MKATTLSGPGVQKHPAARLKGPVAQTPPVEKQRVGEAGRAQRHCHRRGPWTNPKPALNIPSVAHIGNIRELRWLGACFPRLRQTDSLSRDRNPTIAGQFTEPCGRSCGGAARAMWRREAHPKRCKEF